ncbi:methyl-accepting chemotaxis protein, partial [Methylobacterium sp. EM32]
ATSEELAAQAETLQATIAYFRIDGSEAAAGSRGMDGAVSQLRATASRMAAPPAAVKSPAQAPAKRVAAGRPAPRVPAKTAIARSTSGGFALDMGHGNSGDGDERDADFTRVA